MDICILYQNKKNKKKGVGYCPKQGGGLFEAKIPTKINPLMLGIGSHGNTVECRPELFYISS